MILHLVNDEKIINRTIEVFEEAFPGNNLFVVTNKTSSFKYVTPANNVISRTEFYKRKDEFSFDKIFIHLLNKRKISVINRMGQTTAKIYWIIWGLDLYNKLLEPKGFEILHPQSSAHKIPLIKKIITNPINKIIDKINMYRTVRFIDKRVDYIVTDTTENDYEMLMKYYPKFNAIPWKDFFYYPLDVILGEELMHSNINGNNILIGNSASASNNHEYVIDILSRLDTGSSKIIIPLSYSGKKDYVRSVCRKAKLAFSEDFMPLLDFMPLHEYNKLQLSAKVAIFGNWRQEAIGNIIVSLYLGAKVFISRKNPVYSWAIGHGLHVCELETISQHELDTPLDDCMKRENREILNSLYNRSRMIELIRKL